MRPIRVGIVEFPPMMVVTKNSTLDGNIAPHFLNSFYFVFEKTNVTFHSMSGSPKSFCADQGTCNGGLSYMQRGEVDFIGAISPNDWKNIGQNLSVLPILWEKNCHFSYSSKLETYSEDSSFFDFIFSFNFTFWIAFLALFGIFILINSFVLKYKHHFSCIHIFWSQFDYLLLQNFVASEQIQRNFFFLAFIIALLIASKLLSASIKTGMIKQSDYLKLESFTDVINQDFKPYFFVPSHCDNSLNDSTDVDVRTFMERAIWKDLIGQGTDDIFEMLKENRYVTIFDANVYTFVKTYCLYAKDEDKKPLILSEMPVYKHWMSIAINKFNLKSVNDVITKGSQSAIEFGLVEHDRIIKQGIKSAHGFETPSSCLDGNPKEQVINGPITFN